MAPLEYLFCQFDVELWNKTFYSRNPFTSEVLFVVMGIIAVFMIIVAMRMRRQEKREHLYSHSALLEELFAAHDLSLAERALLKNLALAINLQTPDFLFVREDLFRLAIERLPSGMEMKKPAIELHRKLFKFEDPAPPPAAAS